MGKEAKIAEREICKFLAIFLCKCKMAITNIVKTCSYLVQGSGRPSTHREGSQAPSSSQTQSSAQPPPTHQLYTLASSSSNHAIGSQPQAPTLHPQAPRLGPPAPWSQKPSQWYSSDFMYTVRGAHWFSSTQPAPYTPAETWDSRPLSSQVL